LFASLIVQYTNIHRYCWCNYLFYCKKTKTTKNKTNRF